MTVFVLDGHDPDRQFLDATLWLLHGGSPAAIVSGQTPPASIHARTLLEAVPALKPSRLARTGGWSTRSTVLVHPSAHTLERVSPLVLAHEDAEWLLLPSSPGQDGARWQHAWAWAHDAVPCGPEDPHPRVPIDPALHELGGNDRRLAQVTAGGATALREAVDPYRLLRDEELWALTLRSGGTPGTARRLRRTLEDAPNNAAPQAEVLGEDSDDPGMGLRRTARAWS